MEQLATALPLWSDRSLSLPLLNSDLSGLSGEHRLTAELGAPFDDGLGRDDADRFEQALLRTIDCSSARKKEGVDISTTTGASTQNEAPLSFASRISEEYRSGFYADLVKDADSLSPAHAQACAGQAGLEPAATNLLCGYAAKLTLGEISLSPFVPPRVAASPTPTSRVDSIPPSLSRVKSGSSFMGSAADADADREVAGCFKEACFPPSHETLKCKDGVVDYGVLNLWWGLVQDQMGTLSLELDSLRLAHTQLQTRQADVLFQHVELEKVNESRVLIDQLADEQALFRAALQAERHERIAACDAWASLKEELWTRTASNEEQQQLMSDLRASLAAEVAQRQEAEGRQGEQLSEELERKLLAAAEKDKNHQGSCNSMLELQLESLGREIKSEREEWSLRRAELQKNIILHISEQENVLSAERLARETLQGSIQKQIDSEKAAHDLRVQELFQQFAEERRLQASSAEALAAEVQNVFAVVADTVSAQKANFSELQHSVSERLDKSEEQTSHLQNGLDTMHEELAALSKCCGEQQQAQLAVFHDSSIAQKDYLSQLQGSVSEKLQQHRDEFKTMHAELATLRAACLQMPAPLVVEPQQPGEIAVLRDSLVAQEANLVQLQESVGKLSKQYMENHQATRAEAETMRASLEMQKASCVSSGQLLSIEKKLNSVEEKLAQQLLSLNEKLAEQKDVMQPLDKSSRSIQSKVAEAKPNEGPAAPCDSIYRDLSNATHAQLAAFADYLEEQKSELQQNMLVVSSRVDGALERERVHTKSLLDRAQSVMTDDMVTRRDFAVETERLWQAIKPQNFRTLTDNSEHWKCPRCSELNRRIRDKCNNCGTICSARTSPCTSPNRQLTPERKDITGRTMPPVVARILSSSYRPPQQAPASPRVASGGSRGPPSPRPCGPSEVVVIQVQPLSARGSGSHLCQIGSGSREVVASMPARDGSTEVPATKAVPLAEGRVTQAPTPLSARGAHVSPSPLRGCQLPLPERTGPVQAQPRVAASSPLRTSQLPLPERTGAVSPRFQEESIALSAKLPVTRQASGGRLGAMKPGCRVTVLTEFLYAGKEQPFIEGMQGTVTQVDACGDALIDFDDLDVRRWVLRRDFDKLQLQSAAFQPAVRSKNACAAALHH